MDHSTPMHIRADRGSVVLTVVPWLVAVAGFLFGLGMWLTRPALQSGEARATGDGGDVQTLRLSLDAMRGENQALRHELDRLLGSGAARPRPASQTAADKAGETAPAATPSLADDSDFHAITKRLDDALTRFGNGDRSALQTAAVDIMGIIRRGHNALPALQDMYLGQTNAQSRKILLAPILFIGGAEGRDFVMSQAETEIDPDLRKTLLDQSSKYATPDVADRLQGTFVEHLQSDEDATSRLVAVRGLRYAQGNEVQAALLRAAKDQDEKVRLAAIDVLAARPGMLTQLREIASNDPSSHIREVAQCRLMVAENIP